MATSVISRGRNKNNNNNYTLTTLIIKKLWIHSEGNFFED